MELILNGKKKLFILLDLYENGKNGKNRKVDADIL